MQPRANIIGFHQEDREPLAVAWDRMKEAVRNCPNHRMEEWLILHALYNALNPMSNKCLIQRQEELSWDYELMKVTNCLMMCKKIMGSGTWKDHPRQRR